MTEFCPYQQVFQLAFHNCRNTAALIAPPRQREMGTFLRKYRKVLEQSGFKVVWNASKQRFAIVGHSFWVPNKKPGHEHGHSTDAILEGSNAAFHAYPERKYGRTAMLTLVLCFLSPEMQTSHLKAIDEAMETFCAWLQTEEVELLRMPPYRFRPIDEKAAAA